MKLTKNWLWDKKISVKQAKAILHNPEDQNFAYLASLLFLRNNQPKEVFKEYLAPKAFLLNWQKIKRQMRKDNWANPRIDFWQAIYEKLKEKYANCVVKSPSGIANATPINELSKIIADKIKAVRKQKGLSQRDLAKKMKVSQQIISRIESGKENISILTLAKISNALGKKLDISMSDMP